MAPGSRALSGLAFGTLVAVALIMGANHVAARLAFDHGAGVATAVVVRSAAAAIGMGALLALQRVPLASSTRQRAVLLLIGLLVGAQSLCLFASVARIPVALALLVFNTYPIMTALWARCLYGRRMRRALLVAMLIVLVGLALALDVLAVASGVDLLTHWRRLGAGVAFALAASLLFGLVLVFSEEEAGGVDGRVRTFGTMTIAAAVALAAVAVRGGFQWPGAGAGWVGLVTMAVLYATGISIVLGLLPSWGVVGNAAVMNLEPVFALVLAWFMLHQHIAPMQVAGALIVVGAVVVIGVRRR